MTELRKAAEMALEYMNEYYHGYATQAAHHHRVSTALRQALAQPEQEPVDRDDGSIDWRGENEV